MRGQTFTEQRLKIVQQYQDAGQPWPATSPQMAAWAIREGLWKPQPAAMLRQCAEELSRAMREEYYVDPQGRTVRTKHAARIERHGEQMTFWADIRTADPKHMRLAFQQRRQQIVGDCRALPSPWGSGAGGEASLQHNA